MNFVFKEEFPLKQISGAFILVNFVKTMSVPPNSLRLVFETKCSVFQALRCPLLVLVFVSNIAVDITC